MPLLVDLTTCFCLILSIVALVMVTQHMRASEFRSYLILRPLSGLLQITVKNNLPSDWPTTSDGVSIHWHGFQLKGSPFMDGTAYVSQCPIPTGSSFTYRFRVSKGQVYGEHGPCIPGHFPKWVRNQAGHGLGFRGVRDYV